MAEKQIALKHPIKVNGVETSTLQMRSPKMKDIIDSEKAIKDGETEREIYLMAALCGVSPNELSELELSDYMSLQKESKGFLS